jgi:hypothetical protein
MTKTIIECGAMHNKPFCKLIIILSILSIYNANGQILDNKLNIHLGFETGYFHGNIYAKEDGFTFPSLYANMKNITGNSLQGTYNIGKYLKVGLRFEKLLATEWSVKNREEYTNSYIKLQSLSPVLALHTPFIETGFLNKFNFSLGILPTLSYSYLKLDRRLSDIYYLNTRIFENEISDESRYFSIKGNLNIMYNLTQRFGIYSSYLLSYSMVQSNLNYDKGFTLSQIEVGLYMKLLRNKRYLY